MTQAQSRPVISEEEFQDWLDQPVTAAVMERLRQDREDLKEAWAQETFLLNDKAALMALGQASALQKLLELDAGML